MSYKAWERGLQSSAILMNFLAVFCLETAVFSTFPALEAAMDGVQMPQPSLFCQLCLILLPFLYWAIRENAKSFLVFIGGHAVIAVSAVLLLGQNGMQRLVFGIFTAAYTVSSLKIRLTGHETEDGHENMNGKGMEERRLGPVISGIMTVAAYLVCVYVGDEIGCRRIWNTALIFAFLFFVDVYLMNVDRFVQVNRSSNSHIPIRGMLVRGGSLTLGFGTVATLVLAAGADNELTRSVTEFVKTIVFGIIRGVAGVIRFLLSLLESEGGEIAEESAPAMMGGPMSAAEVTEAPLWLEIMVRIVEAALVAATAAVICYLAYKFVSELIRRFYLKREHADEKNGQIVEIRESLKKERDKKAQEKTLSYFSRTPEERIRKSFVKTVRKTEKFRNPDGRAGGTKIRDIWRIEAQENLIRGLTARQICDKVELTGQSDEPKTGWLGIELDNTADAADREAAEKLLALYEKARYGTGSTAEDARNAENAAGKLGRKASRR